MVNLPTKDILSLVMKQRYQMDINGRTKIAYCLLSNQAYYEIESEKNKHNQYIIDGFYCLPKIQDELIQLSSTGFDLAEGEFIVKEAHYPSSKAVNEAYSLAVEDDFRYLLFHDFLNIITKPGIQSSLHFLNLTSDSFYQKFVLETKSLAEIYETQRPDLPSIQQITHDYYQEKKLMKASNTSTNINISSFNQILELIKAIFVKNSNFTLEESKDCSTANFFITSVDDKYFSYDFDYLYENYKVTQNFLMISSSFFPVDSTFLHNIAHSFLDHPCENGFYGCKIEMTLESNNVLSVLSEPYADRDFVKTLLPWDLAALRYSYGMPEARDIIYKLSNAASLEEAFGYPIGNNAIIALSNVGNTKIDILDATTYALDLRYDQLSVIKNEFSDNYTTSFYLSYDTEISEVLVNQSGSITFNDNFNTSIVLHDGCYDIIMHQNNSQNDYLIHYNSETCVHDLVHQIDFFNFNSSLHCIVLQDNIL